MRTFALVLVLLSLSLVSCKEAEQPLCGDAVCVVDTQSDVAVSIAADATAVEAADAVTPSTDATAVMTAADVTVDAK